MWSEIRFKCVSVNAQISCKFTNKCPYVAIMTKRGEISQIMAVTVHQAQ